MEVERLTKIIPGTDPGDQIMITGMNWSEDQLNPVFPGMVGIITTR